MNDNDNSIYNFYNKLYNIFEMSESGHYPRRETRAIHVVRFG